MAATKKNSIRQKLALATCSLLSSQQAASEAVENEWEIDTSFANYRESDDRVKVTKFIVDVGGNISERDNIDLMVVFDTMTGSTPTGSVLQSNVVSVTGTSGAGGFNAQGEATALAPFSDTRLALKLDWEHENNRNRRTRIGSNISVEKDYISIGGSYSVNFDVRNKLTTYELGVAFSLDEISQTGGETPEPMANVNTARFFDEGERNAIEAIAGITNVMSPRLLWQNNLWVAASDGYHTDPYKVISVIANQQDLQLLADQELQSLANQAGVPVSQLGDVGIDANQITAQFLSQKIEASRLHESRPDTRKRIAYYSKFVYSLSETQTAHLSYRYYTDDWEIDAHTIDYKHRFKFGEEQYFEPHFRYYQQSAAEFFAAGIERGTTLPQYASADNRLDDMTGITAGINFGKPVGDNAEIRARLEYISWEAEEAIINETDAFLLQISFRKGF